jgi:hypothetical protein
LLTSPLHWLLFFFSIFISFSPSLSPILSFSLGLTLGTVLGWASTGAIVITRCSFHEHSEFQRPEEGRKKKRVE